MHNPKKFDWNDLKYFLAVARHGSTLAAARALGQSQSTVHRRLERLEERIGRQLVSRHPTGYRLTAFGDEMLPQTEQVEEAVNAFQRKLVASDTEMTGIVTVTCPEAFGPKFMDSGLIEFFKHRYPNINVELIIGSTLLDLSKGDADVAIRAMETVEGPLFGRKIGGVEWAIYADRSYFELCGGIDSIDEIGRHSTVQFDGDLAEHPAAKWFQKVAAKDKVVA